jgi:hypothetical protein
MSISPREQLVCGLVLAECEGDFIIGDIVVDRRPFGRRSRVPFAYDDSPTRLVAGREQSGPQVARHDRPLRGYARSSPDGGYQPGRDNELDQAVQLVPNIYDVMRQAPSDPACTEPFQELLAVIKKAIG